MERCVVKSFNNKNMSFTVVLENEWTDFVHFNFDEIAGSFISDLHPMMKKETSFYDIKFCPEFFNLWCKESRPKLIKKANLCIDKTAQFSVPFYGSIDYCFESAVQRYILKQMQTSECCPAMPFMLCFLERYCMEHEQVVSLLQEEKYQNNEFVKRYFKSREI